MGWRAEGGLARHLGCLWKRAFPHSTTLVLSELHRHYISPRSMTDLLPHTNSHPAVSIYVCSSQTHILVIVHKVWLTSVSSLQTHSDSAMFASPTHTHSCLAVSQHYIDHQYHGSSRSHRRLLTLGYWEIIYILRPSKSNFQINVTKQTGNHQN